MLHQNHGDDEHRSRSRRANVVPVVSLVVSVTRLLLALWGRGDHHDLW